MNAYGFGMMLQKFRIRAGFSQRALAEEAKIDTSYISRIESGERPTTSRTLALQLAKILVLSQEEEDLWLISAGYVSPRIQSLASNSISHLIDNLDSILDNEILD